MRIAPKTVMDRMRAECPDRMLNEIEARLGSKSQNFFDSKENLTRLLASVETWLDTPFHPHASVRGVGVDCVHLVAEIYKDCGLVNEFNPPQYSMDGGRHNHASQVIAYIEATGKFASVPVAMLPGDLLCFRLGKVIHHVGIYLGQNCFVQSVEKIGTKIFSLEDQTWNKRLTAVYRPL